MSNKYRNVPNESPVISGADNIRSEAAKEFGIDGERKIVFSDKGIDKSQRMSVEAQMSGVPLYVKKNGEEKD